MRRRYSRALLALSVCLPGCAQILGADYSAASADAGGPRGADHDAMPAFGDAGTLFDPKPAYLTGAECEACMANNCGGFLTDCAADSFCSAALDDARARPDPLAAYERYRQRYESHWTRDHGGVDAAKATDALTACATNQCAEPCEIGRDFSCTGKFDWPSSFPTEAHLRVRFVNLARDAGYPGWDVRACSRQTSTCDPWLGHAVTDAGGFAELTILNQLGLTPFPEFDGFLLVAPAATDAGPSFYPMMIQQSRPFVTGHYSYWLHPPIDFFKAAFQAGGKMFDPSRGFLSVQPFDCRGLPAKHVTVSVLTSDGGSSKECTECTTYYTDDNNVSDPTRIDLSARGTLVYVTDVPPRGTKVIVRDTSTRRAVGVLRLVTFAGYQHALNIFPRSTEQLADLPASER